MTKSDLTAMRHEIETELQKALLNRETMALFLEGAEYIREEELPQKMARKYIKQGVRFYRRLSGKRLNANLRLKAEALKVQNKRKWVKTYRETFLRAVEREIWKKVKASCWPRRQQK